LTRTKEEIVGDVKLLAAAQDDARRRVGAIRADQWELPTPCGDWTVRDLVVHLVEGSSMARILLEGGSSEDAVVPFGRDHSPDLAAELEGTLAEERVAFERPGAMEMIVHHPGAGDIPGTAFCEFRTGDYLLHGWDIARSIEGDETLPEELVAATWESLQPMVPIIGQIGAFGAGPSGTIGEDAPLQLRLLDLTGRRP
jgi:uncharacterized protein (TIGR03086 family)